MARKKKVPLPGVKTWCGTQKMVTPEELAKYNQQIKEVEDVLRQVFAVPAQIKIPDEIARTLKQSLVWMPGTPEEADKKARAFAWVDKHSRDEDGGS